MTRPCHSKIKMPDQTLVCELVSPFAHTAHKATVAVRLQPNGHNGLKSEKWIYGSVTWNEKDEIDS